MQELVWLQRHLGQRENNGRQKENCFQYKHPESEEENRGRTAPGKLLRAVINIVSYHKLINLLFCILEISLEHPKVEVKLQVKLKSFLQAPLPASRSCLQHSNSNCPCPHMGPSDHVCLSLPFWVPSGLLGDSCGSPWLYVCFKLSSLNSTCNFNSTFHMHCSQGLGNGHPGREIVFHMAC